MKIKEATVTSLINNDNIINHIATCARICYASDSIKDETKFVNALWNNKHRSMFRHAGVYYIIPFVPEIPTKAGSYCDIVIDNGIWYIATNEQCAREHFVRYSRYRIDNKEAEKSEIFKKHKLIRYSLIIETGIDITREYNRKSPNSIAEQSTRYVDFIKKIGIVFKKCHWMYRCSFYKKILYISMLKITEWFYKIARSKYGLNLPPQDARFILPLDTMSKVVYTYSVKEWEYIVNMRLWDYTGKAHQDAKIVGQFIYNEFYKLGYILEKYKHDN